MKNIRKAIGILLCLLVITYLNDNYVRTYYIAYSGELRLVDHFLAGVSIPLILYVLFGKLYVRCGFYFVWCTYWESYQYFQRGYFQYDQYFFDLVGIGLAICLWKYRIVKREEYSFFKNKQNKKV